MTASTQLQYDVQVSALLPAAAAPLPNGERPTRRGLHLRPIADQGTARVSGQG
jgi:hypothetical protein